MPFRIAPWYADPENVYIVILWMIDKGFSGDDVYTFIKTPQKYDRFYQPARRAHLKRVKRLESELNRKLKNKK